MIRHMQSQSCRIRTRVVYRMHYQKGFVGNAIIRRILEEGNHSVVSIDNYSSGTTENHEYFEGDLQKMLIF
jgi:hypothetical protein